MWNLKSNYTNEFIYKEEIDSQAWKTNLWLPEGKGRDKGKLGVWDYHIHTTIYKTENQSGPTCWLLYSIGNYTQYFI